MLFKSVAEMCTVFEAAFKRDISNCVVGIGKKLTSMVLWKKS
jgi:hypothetical protein